MIKKLAIESEYASLAEKIIIINRCEMTSSDFKETLAKRINKLPSYISLKKMKHIFLGGNLKTRTN